MSMLGTAISVVAIASAVASFGRRSGVMSRAGLPGSAPRICGRRNVMKALRPVDQPMAAPSMKEGPQSALQVRQFSLCDSYINSEFFVTHFVFTF